LLLGRNCGVDAVRDPCGGELRHRGRAECRGGLRLGKAGRNSAIVRDASRACLDIERTHLWEGTLGENTGIKPGQYADACITGKWRYENRHLSRPRPAGKRG
jgi:hypothetical protein